MVSFGTLYLINGNNSEQSEEYSMGYDVLGEGESDLWEQEQADRSVGSGLIHLKA